jgi:hypothetical protein
MDRLLSFDRKNQIVRWRKNTAIATKEQNKHGLPIVHKLKKTQHRELWF